MTKNSKTYLLTSATRSSMDHWLTKFPAEHRRSAVIQSLMAVQEQNGGWLTEEFECTGL